MITVGLIKELFFISSYTKKNIKFTFNLHRDLEIYIKPEGKMSLYYNENYIWHEKIEGVNSMFGVESCDAISRIINCIDNNDDGWKKYCYIE